MGVDPAATRVAGATNVQYFIPAQEPAAGTALHHQPDDKPIPKLFQPITIRGATFHNRIWVSPLAQYSSDNGVPTLWHMIHIGGILTHGPGLTMMECTAISSTGRITPEDAGIWSNIQVAAYKQITDFAHSQNQKIGIQIGHSGRKGSTRAAWLQTHAFAVGHVVPKEDGGWPDEVLAPSAVPWSEDLCMPKEMSLSDIKANIDDWRNAARNAVAAGFDVIGIHGAHGFLLSQFASPISNTRTDGYGGTWENRARFLLEVVDAVRSAIPDDMPLFYRVSATEFLEDVLPLESQWHLEDTVKFAGLLADHGVDLIDLSAGGNSQHQKVRLSHLYQVPFAEAVKRVHGHKIHVGAVGGITNGKDAEGILAEEKADVVFVGRQFQKNAGAVWQFAEDLGVDILHPYQIEWALVGRGESITRRLAAPTPSN